MKKLAYLTATFMLLAALAGCGNGNVTSSPTLSPSGDMVSPEVSALPGTEDGTVTGDGTITGDDAVPGDDTGTNGTGTNDNASSRPTVSPAQ